jgi:hypothetical protein
MRPDLPPIRFPVNQAADSSRFIRLPVYQAI